MNLGHSFRFWNKCDRNFESRELNPGIGYCKNSSFTIVPWRKQLRTTHQWWLIDNSLEKSSKIRRHFRRQSTPRIIRWSHISRCHFDWLTIRTLSSTASMQAASQRRRVSMRRKLTSPYSDFFISRRSLEWHLLASWQSINDALPQLNRVPPQVIETVRPIQPRRLFTRRTRNFSSLPSLLSLGFVKSNFRGVIKLRWTMKGTVQQARYIGG